jgi:hypothetical protein
MFHNKRQIETRENNRALASGSIMLIGVLWFSSSLTNIVKPLLVVQAENTHHLDPEQ